MTLLKWENVLLMWVKGALYMKNNPDNLEDTDLEGFARFCFSHVTASSSTPSGPFLNFLTESYPQFTPNLDENGHVARNDYVYVYTFLLHYACVLKSSDYFVKNINNLPNDIRSAVNQFFYLTANGIEESRSRLTNLTVNMINTESDFPNIRPTAPMADRVPAPAPDPASVPVENKGDDDEFCMLFDAMKIMSATPDGEALEQSGSKMQPDECVANNETIGKNASNLSTTEIGSQVNSEDHSTDGKVDFSGPMNANNSSSQDDEMDSLETSRLSSDLMTDNESLFSKEESLFSKEESLSVKEESLSAKEEALFAKEESLSAKEESLSAKEEALFAKEDSLCVMEESLFVKEEILFAEDECLCAKGKSLFIKEVSLSAREESLAVKEEFLFIKEVSLYTKEESLSAKEDYLFAREKSLSVKEHNLIARNESLSTMAESFSLCRDSLPPIEESMELYRADENRRMRQQIKAMETENFIKFVKSLLKLMERYEMANPRLDNFDTSLPFVLVLIDEHLGKFFSKFERETHLVNQMREECAALKAELDLVELGQPLAQSSIIMQPENSEQEEDQNKDIMITSNSQKKLAENYVMEELSLIRMQVARIMEKRSIQNRKLQDLADHLIFQYDEICIMAVIDPIKVQDYFQIVMTEFISGCTEQKETMKYLLQQLMEKRNIDRKTSPVDVDSSQQIIDLQERLEMSQEDLITSEKQLEVSQQELITSQQQLNQVKQQLFKKTDECKRLELMTLKQQLDSYQTTNESSNKVADLQQQLKDFEEKLKQSEQQLDEVKQQLLLKTDECEKLKLLKTPENLEKSQSSEINLSPQTREEPSTSQQHLLQVKNKVLQKTDECDRLDLKTPEQHWDGDASKLITDLKKQCDEIILKAQEKLKPKLGMLEASNEFIKAFVDGKPKSNDFKEEQELLEHIKAMGKSLELDNNQKEMNESNIQMTGVESKNQQSILEIGSLNSELVRISARVMEQLISQDSLAKIQSQLWPANMLANQIYTQEQFIKNYLINILQLKINVLENRQNSILYLFLNEQQKKLQSEITKDDSQTQQHESKFENQKPIQKNVEIQTVLSMTANPANRTQ